MKKFTLLLAIVFLSICSIGLPSQKALASWVDTLPAIPYDVPFSANWSSINCGTGSEYRTFDRYFFYSTSGQIRIVYIEQGYTLPAFGDYYNGYLDIYLQNNPHLQAFNLVSGSWAMQGCMNWVSPDKNQYSVGCPLFYSTIDLYFSGDHDYGSEYCGLSHLTTGKFFTADISLPPPTPTFNFPLSGSLENRTVLLGFGDDWIASCDGQVMKHTGIDIAADEYETVYAAEAGTVKVAQWDSYYGGWVTIEHSSSSSPYTTVYWHIDYIVSENNTVSKGDPIGAVLNYGHGSAVHLHFGFRNGAYSNTANRGRLPQTICGGDPAFPENFVDPATLSFE